MDILFVLEIFRVIFLPSTLWTFCYFCDCFQFYSFYKMKRNKIVQYFQCSNYTKYTHTKMNLNHYFNFYVCFSWCGSSHFGVSTQDALSTWHWGRRDRAMNYQFKSHFPACTLAVECASTPRLYLRCGYFLVSNNPYPFQVFHFQRLYCVCVPSIGQGSFPWIWDPIIQIL